ncbi:MAG: RluA family pseudouridine synthase [Patescibacteria group bacterium]
MTPKIITITSENQGERLDKFLVVAWPDLSRSKIQQAIKDGTVLVNGERPSVHCFLKEKDLITFIEKKEADAKPGATPVKKSQYGGRKLFKEIKIIADEPNFLIIEKPAGLLVHPTERNETDTLIDWLLEKYPALRKIGENPQRPALVHRLDKEVSGLMLIPKTQDAFDYFKSQFKEHTITKKYITLVEGEVNKDEGEIDLPIGRSNTKEGLFAAKPHSQKSDKDKKAITRYKITQRFKNYTLLEVEILTGRTHQIRVHMLAFGCPVVGDGLYIKKPSKKTPGRIFLHATKLIFKDLDGTEKEFESPLPANLGEFLKGLKKA